MMFDRLLLWVEDLILFISRVTAVEVFAVLMVVSGVLHGLFMAFY